MFSYTNTKVTKLQSAKVGSILVRNVPKIGNFNIMLPFYLVEFCISSIYVTVFETRTSIYQGLIHQMATTKIINSLDVELNKTDSALNI